MAMSAGCAQRTLHWVFELIRVSLEMATDRKPFNESGREAPAPGCPGFLVVNDLITLSHPAPTQLAIVVQEHFAGTTGQSRIYGSSTPQLSC